MCTSTLYSSKTDLQYQATNLNPTKWSKIRYYEELLRIDQLIRCIPQISFPYLDYRLLFSTDNVNHRNVEFDVVSSDAGFFITSSAVVSTLDDIIKLGVSIVILEQEENKKSYTNHLIPIVKYRFELEHHTLPWKPLSTCT